jgi:hypothetical protein
VDAFVAACAAGSAVSGLLAAGRPTGLAGPDALARAAVAAGLTLAASRARPWSLVLLGATAAALSGTGSVTTAAGWIALFLALAAFGVQATQAGSGVHATQAGTARPQPGVSALVGALAGAALLRLPPTDPSVIAPVAAGSAALAVVVSAVRSQPVTGLRRLRRAGRGLAGAAVLASAGLAFAAVRSAAGVDEGMAQARAGLDAAASGDQTGADAHLRRAEAAFAGADTVLNAWYARPARLVPVVGQQAGALGGLAAAAHHLSAAAADSAARIDLRQIAVDGGRVDLDRVAALDAPLADVEAALGRAQADTDAIGTDWVLPAIGRHRQRLVDEVHRTRARVGVAHEAVRLAPDLLGAHGPRRWFVAFTTPAEARGLGGMMGNFAVLTAVDGRVEVTRSDRTAAIEPGPGDPPRPLDAPADYVARYGWSRPQDLLRDVTQSPDLPSVTRVIRGAYPRAAGGEPVDGVIVADPYAIAAVLRLTGPIKVTGMPEALSAANAADVLLRDQYEAFRSANDRRIDFLGEAARQAFDALVHLRTVEPARWAEVLGPMVAQRRLLVASARPDEQHLLGELGLTGAFPAPDHAPGADFVAFTTSNWGNNKIDAYLHRSLDYRAEHDPATGAVHAHAVVTLRNDAPDHGLAPYVIRPRRSAHLPDGTNWLVLSVYSPHRLVAATVRGADNRDRRLAMGAERELGRNVYTAYLAVPAGTTATVDLELEGSVTPGGDYRLSWFQQPAVYPDEITVTARSAGRATTEHRTSDRDGHVSFPTAPPIEDK